MKRLVVANCFFSVALVRTTLLMFSNSTLFLTSVSEILFVFQDTEMTSVYRNE